MNFEKNVNIVEMLAVKVKSMYRLIFFLLFEIRLSCRRLLLYKTLFPRGIFLNIENPLKFRYNHFHGKL